MVKKRIEKVAEEPSEWRYELMHDNKGAVSLSSVTCDHRICPKGSKNDRIGNHSASQVRSLSTWLQVPLNLNVPSLIKPDVVTINHTCSSWNGYSLLLTDGSSQEYSDREQWSATQQKE